jgi:hypothetical protein
MRKLQYSNSKAQEHASRLLHTKRHEEKIVKIVNKENNVRGKAINIIYLCVCSRACVFVALLIQQATRMRHIVTSFADSLVPLYFWHYLTKGTIFEKIEVIEHNMCVLIFSTPFCL